MTPLLSFHVAADPAASKQARIVTRDPQGNPLRFPRKFIPRETQSFREAVRASALEAQRDAGLVQQLTGPLLVRWLAVFQLPVSRHRKSGRPRQWHTKRPDAENIQKALFDAITDAGVWVDDSQVVGWPLKLYGQQGEPPGVYVTVYDLSAVAVPGGAAQRLFGELEREQPSLFVVEV